MWSPEEPAAEPFIRLAEALQRAGAYPGDDRFDATGILASLAHVLRRAIELRTARGGNREARPVVEIVNRDWAVTQFGLDALTLELWVSADELTQNSDAAWERLEADPRLEDDEHQQALRDAFDVAQAFHGRRRADERVAVWRDVFRPPQGG
jgi:hypothetical protein